MPRISCKILDRTVRNGNKAASRFRRGLSNLGLEFRVASKPAIGKSGRLRVLQMCTDFGTGGISRHALDLQSWLNAQGHQVSLGGTAGEWAGPDTDADFLDIPTRFVAAEGGNIVARLGYTVRSAMKMRQRL